MTLWSYNKFAKDTRLQPDWFAIFNLDKNLFSFFIDMHVLPKKQHE